MVNLISGYILNHHKLKIIIINFFINNLITKLIYSLSSTREISTFTKDRKSYFKYS